jgi:hypothetical protein
MAKKSPRVKGLGKGNYINLIRGNPNYGKTFRKGAGGKAVYGGGASPNVKSLGGGKYKNTKKGSPRYGKTFTNDSAGNHVYEGGKVVGKKTVPFNASAPIATEQEFNSRVGAAQQLKYGQAESQLQGQIRASGQDAANRGAWFQDYQRAVGEANARQQAFAQGAQSAIYNQANQSRAQDSAQGNQLDQAGQAAAALRGTTQAPSVAPQAAAGRQALSNSFGGFVGAQGVAQGAYGATQYSNAAGLRAQALSSEQGNRRKLEEQGRQMSAEKGAYGVEYGQSLRDKEHTKKLEIAAYDLNTQKAAADAADAAADNKRQDKILAQQRKKALWEQRNKDRDYRLNKKKYGADRADEMWNRDFKNAHPPNQGKGKGGGSGGSGGSKTGLTPSKTLAYRDQLRTAKGIAGNYISHGKYKKGASRGKVINGLIAKGIPPDLAKAAVIRVEKGGVLPGTARQLKRDYGVGIKTRHGRPKGNPGSPSMPHAR